MEKQVRVGVVGTSWWADMMYLPVLQDHPGAVTSAICGRNRERAQEMADKYGIPQVFTDYQDMIRRGDLDALVIAVPDDLHFPIAQAAMEAGLHVLCEKPMAFNLDQARSMLAQAEAARIKHMVLYTWRWMPYFRSLAYYLEQGYIGRCYNAQFRFVGDYARAGEYQWKWDRAHGLGVLGDLGSHMIDLARLTVGEIASVQASLDICVPKAHPEGRTYDAANDSAMLALKFANGAAGAIFVTAVGKGQEQRATLYGEEGTLEVIANFSTWSVRGLRGNETEFSDLPIPEAFLSGTRRDAPFFDQFAQIFSTQLVGPRLFIDSILGDQPATPGFVDGLKAQEVLEAAFNSDQSGCWVDIGLPPS